MYDLVSILNSVVYVRQSQPSDPFRLSDTDWIILTVAYLNVSLSAVGNKTCSSAEKLQEPNFSVQFCESNGKYFLTVSFFEKKWAVKFRKLLKKKCQKWPVPLYRYRSLSDRVQLVAIQLFRSHRSLLNSLPWIASGEPWWLTFVMMTLLCGFKVPGDRVM